MYAGLHNFDDMDKFLHSSLGKYLCIEWQEGLFSPPKGVAFGTHIAGYLVCDHENGIKSYNVAWMYSDQTGKLFRVGRLFEGIDCLWIFKYETLKKMSIRLLADSELDDTALPSAPPGADSYSRAELDEIRRESVLDTYRHPGFPDDVSVSIGPVSIEKQKEIDNHFAGEQVWVRLEKKVGENKYAGKLLNNSLAFGLKPGHAVLIQYACVNGKSFLFSDV